MPHHEQPDHRPRRTGAEESGDDESARAEGPVTRPAGPTSDDDHDAPTFEDSACDLRAENRRLERLVRTFGHDLRGQLMVASGHLELAREETDATDHLDAIDRAHDRIEALVEDVSALVDDGGVVGEREPLVLERLVEDCWAAVETTGATVVVDADRAVRADASRLSQVFENLFRNAVEHGAPSSRTLTDDAETTALTVTVGLLPNETGVFVEDDGPGIPAERREDVFEAGVSTDEGGTGLGLAIVRDVVGAHGWDIEVTEGSDGGARFEITGVELRPPDA
ncbi:HAMP domain-containing sensor histidine kinase [Natronomonas sp. CBA1123]|uniref:sensor histidine kinase n=1 Tax=Natronomonas sp. CBA1123 TaxID=2668070 RepID=UPI001E64082B|nr:HAMP domain-containing sensor histidine kinase [Natronomonas sp. CBA1123]